VTPFRYWYLNGAGYAGGDLGKRKTPRRGHSRVLLAIWHFIDPFSLTTYLVVEFQATAMTGLIRVSNNNSRNSLRCQVVGGETSQARLPCGKLARKPRDVKC